MSMKKKALMAASYVMVAAMAIGGTVAYLTDTDDDINTMTLGNIKIEQHEYQRQVGDDGSYKKDTVDKQESYVLEDYVQDKPLLPTTDPTNHGAGPWDTTTVRMSQVDSYGGMSVFSNKNAQDKFVTVENTGLNAAYVRTLVAVEVGSKTGAVNSDLIGVSCHTTWDQKYVGTVKIDGNNYDLIEYTYKGADDLRHKNGILPAGDTSYPNLSQVYLSSVVTSEDIEAIDGNNNGKLDILVFSQAVQADGFEAEVDEKGAIKKSAAEVALDAGFGDITVENHPWKNASVTDDAAANELTAALSEVSNAADPEERVATMEDDLYTSTPVDLGSTGVTLDGAGNTLAKFGNVGKNDGVNAGVKGTAGTVKNLNIVDNTNKDSYRGFRAIYFTGVTGDMTVEDCKLDGTYAINVNVPASDVGKNTLTVKNTVLNGWTSYGKIKGATFTNCTFGQSTAGYAFLRAYADTTFTNCNFDAGFKVDIDDASGAKLTFENCTLDGVALTSANIANLLDNAKEASAVKVN